MQAIRDEVEENSRAGNNDDRGSRVRRRESSGSSMSRFSFMPPASLSGLIRSALGSWRSIGTLTRTPSIPQAVVDPSSNEDSLPHLE